MSHGGDYLQGKLILDSGKLTGSFFDKSVILICRHDASGAFGLMLNRPLKKNLGKALEEKVSAEAAKLPLFLGGPVQPEYLSFVAETESQLEYEVLPRITVGHSLHDLQMYLEEKKKARVHAFAGYAGWSPGQLENEIKSGSWIVHHGATDLIFFSKPDQLWRQVLKQKGGVYHLCAECPDDPSLN